MTWCEIYLNINAQNKIVFKAGIAIDISITISSVSLRISCRDSCI